MTEPQVVNMDGAPLNLSAPSPEPATDLHKQIMLIQRWRRILAVRWLALLALLGAVGMWGYTISDPTPWRLGTACGYAVLVLIPSFVLYFRRSD